MAPLPTMTQSSYAAAKAYLTSHSVLSLATCVDSVPCAVPWVAPVFYAQLDERLVFLSAAHTRHCQNIAVNSAVAGSIQEDYSGWMDIKGIQLQGHASLVADSRLQSVISHYGQKFPIVGHDAPPAIANALDRISWYEITVSEIFFVDNAKGLGHRVELDPKKLLAGTIV